MSDHNLGDDLFPELSAEIVQAQRELASTHIVALRETSIVSVDNGDPWTSYHASFSTIDASRAHRARIYFALDFCGPSTFSELARATGLSESAVWRRLSELHQLKLIERTDETRNGASDRPQSVWRVVAKDDPRKKHEQ